MECCDFLRITHSRRMAALRIPSWSRGSWGCSIHRLRPRPITSQERCFLRQLRLSCKRNECRPAPARNMFVFMLVLVLVLMLSETNRYSVAKAARVREVPSVALRWEMRPHLRIVAAVAATVPMIMATRAILLRTKAQADMSTQLEVEVEARSKASAKVPIARLHPTTVCKEEESFLSRMKQVLLQVILSISFS